MNNYKIVIIGDTGVGKTSIIKSIIGNPFSDREPITVGAMYNCHKINDDITLEFWDVAGQKKFIDILKNYYTKADYILLAYDLNDLSTIKRIKQIIEIINADIESPKYILVGNKVDLIKNSSIFIDNYIKKHIKSENIITSIYTSAKNGNNISELLNIITKNIIKNKNKKNKIPKDRSYSILSFCTIL